MNVLKHKIKGLMMVSAVLFLFSCKKEVADVVKSPAPEKELNVNTDEIKTLTNFLATITQFDSNEMSYNPANETFYYKGVAQINLHFLRLTYSQRSK